MAGRIYWKGKKGNHTPEHYLDVEVKTRGLLGINMTWEWEGEPAGWCGTRMGVYQHFTNAQLLLQLMREDKVGSVWCQNTPKLELIHSRLRWWCRNTNTKGRRLKSGLKGRLKSGLKKP